MSTLKTNTIQHLTSGFNNVIAHTDGAGTANAVHCRAWVNFNGTSTVTIRGSFNVTSITDNGTGSFGVNLTNAMSDANYAVNYTGGYQPGVDARVHAVINSDVGLTSSVIRTLTVRPDAVNVDSDYNNVSVFR